LYNYGKTPLKKISTQHYLCPKKVVENGFKEAAEVQDKVKHSIDFLTKGCSCKKGCKTANYGCKKRARYCGPACLCQGCVNLQAAETRSDNADICDPCSSDDGESTEENESSDEEQCMEEEIIRQLFYACIHTHL